MGKRLLTIHTTGETESIAPKRVPRSIIGEGRRRTDGNRKERMLALQDRPLTADTAYYVRLWNAKGDTPEEIAMVLNRSVEQVRDLIER